MTAGKSQIRFAGSGPGAQTLDGCSVEFYRKLDVGNEPAIVVAAHSPPASLLELGCGVGRITKPLVRLGYNVTAVDNSSEMLEHVNFTRAVHSDIESLHLNRRFDVVLLGSFLLNVLARPVRLSLLAAARRHLQPGDDLVAQIHSNNILQPKVDNPSKRGNLTTTITSAEVCGSIAGITIQYEIDNCTWTQTFETAYVTLEDICNNLNSSDLQFCEWLDEEETWFRAIAT